MKAENIGILMKKWIKRIVPASATYLAMQGVLYSKIRLIFQFPDTVSPAFAAMMILGVCFGIGLLTLFFAALDLVIQKDQLFLSYVRYFALYLLIMGVFFLLTFPGIFKGDEFYVLKAALSFQMSPAQSGLTSLFYICCLLFFPSMATITGVQLVIICAIFAYIMKNIRDIYPTRWSYLLMVPCLFFPIIDGNLFTLRATLVGWLFALMLFKVFFLYMRQKRSGQMISRTDALSLILITGLLCAWRSEYLYLVLFLPLILVFLKLCDIRRAGLMVVALILSFQIWNIPNRIALDGSNKYPISLVLNPVANIFTEEHMEGPQVYEDILTINELVDVQLLRKSASVRNISQYWNIPDEIPREQLKRFMAASLRIILYNFDDYLKYRFQTFAYTNGFYEDRINHPGGEAVSGILNLIYYDEDYKTKFIFVNPILTQELREKTIELLACRHYVQGESTTNILLPVFYNCVPVIVLILICVILAVYWRKLWFMSLTILCMAQLVLIFLTAPASFFMYYFCFYLCGYLLCALFVVDLIHTVNHKASQPK